MDVVERLKQKNDACDETSDDCDSNLTCLTCPGATESTCVTGNRRVNLMLDT